MVLSLRSTFSTNHFYRHIMESAISKPSVLSKTKSAPIESCIAILVKQQQGGMLLVGTYSGDI